MHQSDTTWALRLFCLVCHFKQKRPELPEPQCGSAAALKRGTDGSVPSLPRVAAGAEPNLYSRKGWRQAQSRSEAAHLMEAERGRCSRESITQPMWASWGGLELWLVFFFLSIWTTDSGRLDPTFVGWLGSKWKPGWSWSSWSQTSWDPLWKPNLNQTKRQRAHAKQTGSADYHPDAFSLKSQRCD